MENEMNREQVWSITSEKVEEMRQRFMNRGEGDIQQTKNCMMNTPDGIADTVQGIQSSRDCDTKSIKRKGK